MGLIVELFISLILLSMARSHPRKREPIVPFPSVHSSPGELAHATYPGTIRTPALDTIDRALQKTAAGHQPRLIVTMPPQEGKSSRISRDFPLWWLTRLPLSRIILASYGDDLAIRNGRAIRNLIRSNPQLGLTLQAGNAPAKDWRLANRIGGIRSVGIGAGITGHSADLLIIDDPIKSQAEADSERYQTMVWDWWQTEAATRLAPNAPVVLVQTRWHENDLAGRLLTQEDSPWVCLNIPAQAETNDPLGRQPGEYLTSARQRTPTQWAAIRKQVGARAWAALYQGHPAPAAGGIFNRDWWRTWYDPPRLGTVIQSWDMAFKGTDTADYVVGQIWAQDGPNLYLLDQVRGRWTFTETCRQVLQLSQRWPMATAKLVEDKANGTAVIDALSQQIPGLIPVEPRGGKTVRAAAVSPLVEAGNIHIPATNWASDLIEEAAAFPNAAHDDQVDALTQALTYLALPAGNTKTGSQFFNIG